MKKQILVLFLAVAMIFSAFTACAGDDEIISAIVLSQPTKAEYVVGETFDFTGATLELTMKDGSTKVVEITAAMLSEIPTFSEPGQKTIAVTYTEGETTLTAYIKVTVTGEKVTSLGVAQENAKNSLAAFYATLVFTAPAGYPASTEDYATPAQAVYNKAIADIMAATDAKTVYVILGRAQSELSQLDNYVDFYATVKWQEIEDKFVEKYAGNETMYLDDYVMIEVLKNASKNLILRARSLDKVEEIFNEWVADDAENKTVVQKIAEELLNVTWPIDIPEVQEDDADDATMQAYFKIMAYMTEAMEVAYGDGTPENPGNPEFAVMLEERLNAYDLSQLPELDQTSALYTEVLVNYVYGAAGEEVLCLVDMNGDGALADIASRIMELAIARLTANVATDLPALQNTMTKAEYDEATADMTPEEKEAFDLQFVADMNTAEFPITSMDDLKLYDFGALVGMTGDEVLVFLPAAYETTISLDAFVADLLEEVGKDEDGNYNAITYGSALADKVYALADRIENDWIQIYGIDEINLDLIDGYQDLLSLVEALDNIAAALVDPALPTLDISAQIILGTSEADLAAQRAIAEAYATEAGIPVTAQYTDGVDTYYVIPNYDRLLVAEERLAELAEAKVMAEAQGGLKELISYIPTKLLYNQYAEVVAAEDAYTALVNTYKLTETFELFAGEATTAATVEANLKAIIGETDLATYRAALARRDQLNAAATEAYDLGGVYDLIQAIGNVTLDSVTLAGDGALDVAQDAYDLWATNYNIDEENAALILGDAYTTYTDANAKYADLQEKLTALKTLIASLPSVNAATSQSAKIAQARTLFIELCAANSDPYYNDGELITPVTTHHDTYKHLTDSTTALDGALYEKLVALEAAVFEMNLNVHINEIIGKIAELYNKYYNAIGGNTRQDDVTALQAAQAELNTIFSKDVKVVLNAASFADGLMEGYLPTDMQAQAFEMIDETFDSEAEPYFQQTIRYIITGDATNGYDLIVYTDGSYLATDMLDKNGNVVTAYNTITLTSTNITLNGFTANEVIVGATVAPISTFAVNPLTVSLNGCNITNLTINGTAPAEIFVADETAIGTITAATVLNLNGDLSETKVIVSLDGISTSIIATDVASISIDALGNINVVAATVDIDIVVADGSNVVPNVVLGAATTGTIDSNKALNPASATGETEVTITVTPENVNPGQGTPTTPGAGDETEGTYSPTVPGTPIA
jgi:hypothetical protein